jgi:hypothetical protein
MKPEYIAQVYAKTLSGRPNAWGQHVHQTLGRSDHIMGTLFDIVGSVEGMRLINEAFARLDASC